VVVNLILYQIVWTACVMGAAENLPLLGPAAAALAIAWHLLRAARPLPELALILIAGTLGGIWDSLLVSLDLVRYASANAAAGLAPYWIVGLWMAFATTFNLSFRWLKGHWILAGLVGLLGGPLAWWAGAQLDALVLVKAKTSLTILGIGWALLLPTLMAMAQRLNGISLKP